MLRRGPIKRSEVNRRLCVVGLGFRKSKQQVPPPLRLVAPTNCSVVKVIWTALGPVK